MQSHIDNIYQQIQRYNQNKKEAEQINFLHGGSSAVFALLGQPVTVVSKAKRLSPKEEKQQSLQSQLFHVEEKTIDNKLYSTGVLRKEFGIYPFGGELSVGAFGSAEGKRREGVNYKSISGMDATMTGVTETLKYAKHAKRFNTIADMHKRITSIITQIERSNCIRSMKILLMEFTNVMLMDPHAKQKKAYYLALLRNERDNMLAMAGSKNDKAFNELLKKYDKYYKRIENILNSKNLPFKANPEFRQQIIEQYPVIYCAAIPTTQTAILKFSGGISSERLINREIDLASVKLLFTPEEYVDDLRKRLSKLGLDHIVVHGMPSLVEEKLAPVKKAGYGIQEALIEHLNDFFINGDEESYKQALDIMQHHLIINANNIFYRFRNDYDNLSQKMRADPQYIKKTAGAIDLHYYKRLQQFPYLFSIAHLSDYLRDEKSKSALREIYAKKGDYQRNILQLLNLTDYIDDKSLLLQNLYIFFTSDPEIKLTPEELKFLIHQYKLVIAQLNKEDKLSEVETESQLYQLIYPPVDIEAENPALILLGNIKMIQLTLTERMLQPAIDEKLLEFFNKLETKIQKLQEICRNYIHSDLTEKELIEKPDMQAALQEYDEVTMQIEQRSKEIVAEAYMAEEDSISTSGQTKFFSPPTPPETSEEWDILNTPHTRDRRNALK